MSYRIEHPEMYRSKIIEKTREILVRVIEPCDVLTLGDRYKEFMEKWPINMEVGVFNYAVREANHRRIVKKWMNPMFVQLYTNRLRTLWNNLESSEFLKKGIIGGMITAEALSNATHQDMDPDHWTVLIAEKTKRDEFKKKGDIVESMTDMFVCRKCKGNKTTYFEIQSRSADESMTCQIQCVNPSCNFRWKIN